MYRPDNHYASSDNRRFGILNPAWQLRGWLDHPRVLINWRTRKRYDLDRHQFYVAKSCNGQIDFQTMAFAECHRAFLSYLVSEGVARLEIQPSKLLPGQHFHMANTPFIKGVYWAVTGVCNLRCRHCFMGGSAGEGKQLPLALMLRIIHELSEANVQEVTITGGEPLLREDFFDILRALLSVRILPTTIITNGSLINNAFLDQMTQMPIRPRFAVSFDGIGAQEMVRGSSFPERLYLDNIRALCELGFPVVVITTLFRDTLFTLEPTYEILRGIAPLGWSVNIARRLGRWRQADAFELGDYQSLLDAFERIVLRWESDSRPFNLNLDRLFSSSELGDMSASGPDYASPEWCYSPSDYLCPRNRYKPALMPTGWLLPCPAFVGGEVDTSMPNIFHDGLCSAWRDSSLRSFVDQRKEELLARNKDCSNCAYFKTCGMGCPAVALSEEGSILSKDPVACHIWKSGYRGRLFGLLNHHRYEK